MHGEGLTLGRVIAADGLGMASAIQTLSSTMTPDWRGPSALMVSISRAFFRQFWPGRKTRTGHQN